MTIPKNSVGIVEKKYFELGEPLELVCGKSIENVTICYETYGKLNKDKSNAILIFHALSGDSHTAGYYKETDNKPGWWDNQIGPGKAFDTNKYFVICTNVIGGCSGSTGASSINQKTKKPYGINFPVITIKDMISAQKKLIDNLGIKKLHAAAGGSMGGMQALRYAIDFPEGVKLVIPIACAAKQSAQNIAFHEVGRQAITSDPNWNKGDYYGKSVPKQGLSVARMIAHITYLSNASMKEKFGRKLQDKKRFDFSFGTEFAVESYLKYQGEKFVDRFDANSYLYITRAIDYFDLTEGETKELETVFSNIKSKFLVLSFTSDWLYTTEESKEIVQALLKNGVDAVFFEIEAEFGHDSFLIENETQESLIKSFLNHNYDG